MSTIRRGWIPAALSVLPVLLLAACARGPSSAGPPPVVPEPGAKAATSPQSKATEPLPPVATDRMRCHYELDGDLSRILVYLYPDGRLARFGHHHVIRLAGLQGQAGLDQLGAWSAELAAPLARIHVDEPELRAAAGPGFERPLSEDARSGTRTNLLGPAQLDAGSFPWLRLTAHGDLQPGKTLPVQVRLFIQDRQVEFSAPLTLRREPGRVSVEGEMELAQTAIGLRPYSALAGALRVRDEMSLKIGLVWTQVNPATGSCFGL